ncbi:hypothetical protein ApDm4_0210 [Acetobacter pomorum]|nr:hypothetical protein ApDm4_0210 [Acetobacter pomorum]
MRYRAASINDQPISADDRLFHWPAGRRPEDHPELPRVLWRRFLSDLSG